ncbi:MAG: hypothetical protein ACLT98_02165 [Eggerthellaceae bacterium]
MFNFNHWRSLSWEPVTLNAKVDLQQTADGRYRASAIDNDVEFEHLGVKVPNLRLDFSGNQGAQNVGEDGLPTRPMPRISTTRNTRQAFP